MSDSIENYKNDINDDFMKKASKKIWQEYEQKISQTFKIYKSEKREISITYYENKLFDMIIDMTNQLQDEFIKNTTKFSSPIELLPLPLTDDIIFEERLKQLTPYLPMEDSEYFYKSIESRFHKNFVENYLSNSKIYNYQDFAEQLKKTINRYPLNTNILRQETKNILTSSNFATYLLLRRGNFEGWKNPHLTNQACEEIKKMGMTPDSFFQKYNDEFNEISVVENENVINLRKQYLIERNKEQQKWDDEEQEIYKQEEYAEKEIINEHRAKINELDRKYNKYPGKKLPRKNEKQYNKEFLLYGEERDKKLNNIRRQCSDDWYKNYNKYIETLNSLKNQYLAKMEKTEQTKNNEELNKFSGEQNMKNEFKSLKPHPIQKEQINSVIALVKNFHDKRVENTTEIDQNYTNFLPLPLAGYTVFEEELVLLSPSNLKYDDIGFYLDDGFISYTSLRDAYHNYATNYRLENNISTRQDIEKHLKGVLKTYKPLAKNANANKKMHDTVIFNSIVSNLLLSNSAYEDLGKVENDRINKSIKDIDDAMHFESSSAKLSEEAKNYIKKLQQGKNGEVKTSSKMKEDNSFENKVDNNINKDPSKEDENTINNFIDKNVEFAGNKTSDMKNKFENFVNKTKEFSSKVKDGVVKNSQKFNEKLKPYIAKTKEVFSSAMSKVKESATKFANNTKDYFSLMSGKNFELASRESNFDKFVNKIKEFASKAKGGIVKNTQKFKEKLKPCTTKMKEKFAEFSKKVREFARNRVDEEKEFFSNMSGKFMNLPGRDVSTRKNNIEQEITSDKVNSSPTPSKKVPLKPKTKSIEPKTTESEKNEFADATTKKPTEKSGTKKVPPKKPRKQPSKSKSMEKPPKDNNLGNSEPIRYMPAVIENENLHSDTKDSETSATDTPKNTESRAEKIQGFSFDTTANSSQSANWSSDIKPEENKKESDWVIPDYEKIFGANNSKEDAKDNSNSEPKRYMPAVIEKESAVGKESVDGNDTHSKKFDKSEFSKDEVIIDANFSEKNESSLDKNEFFDKNTTEKPLSAESRVKSEPIKEENKTETVDEKGEEEVKDNGTKIYTFEAPKDYYTFDAPEDFETSKKDAETSKNKETPISDNSSQSANGDSDIKPEENKKETTLQKDTGVEEMPIDINKFADVSPTPTTESAEPTKDAEMPKSEETPLEDTTTKKEELKTATEPERIAQAYVLVSNGGKSLDEAMKIIGETTYEELDKIVGADGAIQTAKRVVTANAEELLDSSDKYKVVINMVDYIRRERIRHNPISDPKQLYQNLPTELIGPDEFAKDLMFLAPFLKEQGVDVGEMSKNPNGQFIPSKEMQQAFFDYTNNYKEEKKIKTPEDLENHIANLSKTYGPYNGDDVESIKRRDAISENSKELAQKVAQNNSSNGYNDICKAMDDANKKKEPPPEERKPFDINFGGSIAKIIAYSFFAGALFFANPILLFFALFCVGVSEVFPPSKLDPTKGFWKIVWDKFHLDNVKEKELYNSKSAKLKREHKAEKKLSKTYKQEKKVSDKLSKLDQKKNKAFPEEKRMELESLKEKEISGNITKEEKDKLETLKKEEETFNKLVSKYNKVLGDKKHTPSGSEKYEIYNDKASDKIEHQNELFNKQKEQFQSKIESQIKETQNVIDLIENKKLAGYGKTEIDALKKDIESLRAYEHEASVLKNPEYEHNDIIKKKLDANPHDKSAYDEVKESIDFSETFKNKLKDLGLDKNSGTLAKIKESEDFKKLIDSEKVDKKTLEGKDVSTER